MVMNSNIEVHGMWIFVCVLALAVPVFSLGYYIYLVLFQNVAFTMSAMLTLIGKLFSKVIMLLVLRIICLRTKYQVSYTRQVTE